MFFIKEFKYYHIYLPSLIFISIGFYIDSKELSLTIPYNQWITNLIFLLIFIYIFKNATYKVKKLISYGFFLGVAGESFFCLCLGMYSYRLDNLPIYIPLGHSVVYATVFYLAKEPLFKSNQKIIIISLYITMVLFSFTWLFLKNDIFGFICFSLIVYLLYKKLKSHLFYLIMFFVVLYIELTGTYFGCWIYPDIWFNKIELISSANPPSSISIFYFGFDLGCLWIYKQLNKEKWNKMINIRKLKLSKIKV